MKSAWFFLLAVALAGVVMISGCTSQTGAPFTPTASASTMATPVEMTSLETLSGMALEVSDFPPGFELLFEGETMPPEESTLLSDPSYQGGYSVTVSNESSDLATGELIEQVILVYTQPATRERLDEVFLANYPEFSDWSLSQLKDPGIGDASVAYRFAYPNTTLSGYSIGFGKGDVYEILLTMAGDDTADYDLLEAIARKAASKVT